MKLYFDRWVLAGFLTAFVIIIGLGFYSFFNTQRFARTGRLVAHTNEVMLHIEKVLANVVDIEAYQRGFVVTGDGMFFQSIAPIEDTVRFNLRKLFELTTDNARQQERLVLAQQHVEDKIRFINKTTEARKQSFEAARDMIISGDGLKIMTAIRATFDAMQADERALLSQRIAQNENDFNRFIYAFVALLVTTAIILGVVFFMINVNLTARTGAERALRKAAAEIRDLYNNAPCGYHSLDNNGVFVEINSTLLSWLGYAREEIVEQKKFSDVITPQSAMLFKEKFATFKAEGAVANLEFDFIRKNGTLFPAILSSTAIRDSAGAYLRSSSTVFDISERKKSESRILQLNSELEAFTYSVSHDLRAPLRSISGYARIVSEDYAPSLDDEGKRVIEVIIKNAKRMGQLIDDLLEFSRLGRKEVYRAEFDINALVDTVVKEQQQHRNGTTVAVAVDDLLPCKADVATMQQVWINLISNAFKYSSKNPQPVVHIGSYRENGSIVYFVSDNGVGFDMQYAGKLFGVFNRLHKIQEFDGTGVGLAIVHRIVSKHDGKVWATAKLNEGATFFFSIPDVTT